MDSVLSLIATGPGPDLTPVDTAANSILTYWLSFGAIAVVAAALFFLYVWPGKLAEKIRRDARTDLLEENERLRAALTEKDKAVAEANGRADALAGAVQVVADSFTEARQRRRSKAGAP